MLNLLRQLQICETELVEGSVAAQALLGHRRLVGLFLEEGGHPRYQQRHLPLRVGLVRFPGQSFLRSGANFLGLF